MKFAKTPSAGQALHVVGVAVRQEEFCAAKEFEVTSRERVHEQRAGP